MVHGGVPMTGGTRKAGYSVQVTGLNQSVRKTDLQGTFGEFGQIARIDMSGPKAFLEFDDKRDAEDAIKSMDGKNLLGCLLRVQMKVAEARIIKPVVDAYPQASSNSGPVGAPPRTGGPTLHRPKADDVASVPSQTKRHSDKVADMLSKDESKKRRRESRSCDRRDRDRARQTIRKDSGYEDELPVSRSAKGKKDSLRDTEDNLERKHARNVQESSKKNGDRDRERAKDHDNPKEGELEHKKKKRKKRTTESGTSLLAAESTAPLELPVAPEPVAPPAQVQPSLEPVSLLKPVVVNWSNKVQEWMAKKAKEDALLPVPEPIDNEPVMKTETREAQMQESGVDSLDGVVSNVQQSSMQESAEKEKAERLAAAARKCESEAVQEILDRALAAKLAAVMQPPSTRIATTTPPAIATPPPASASSTSKCEETGAATSVSVSRSDVGLENSSRQSPSRNRRRSQSRSVRRIELRPRESVQRGGRELISSGREKSHRQRSTSPRRRRSTSRSVPRCSRSPRRRNGSPKLRRQGLFRAEDFSKKPSDALAKGKTEAPAAFQPVAASTNMAFQSAPQVAAPSVSANLGFQSSPPLSAAATAVAAATNIGFQSTPAVVASAPSSTNSIPGVVPSWVWGPQAGLGVQADGTVFGHGGVVNTASGEWLCPRCRWRNYNTRRQCVQCKLGRPY